MDVQCVHLNRQWAWIAMITAEMFTFTIRGSVTEMNTIHIIIALYVLCYYDLHLRYSSMDLN
jgi:hypothetical protein